MTQTITQIHTLSFEEVLLRLALAVLCGGLIGMERERRGRPAGLRTYTIVCLGATLTMLLSQYNAAMLSGPWAALDAQTDISRFSAQVINGVGFIGAGTVLTTDRQKTKGLTTAACLWASACMGIAIGAGFYTGVLIGYLVIFVVVCVLPVFEGMLRNRTKNMDLTLGMEQPDGIRQVIDCLKQRNVTIYDMDISKRRSPDQMPFQVSISMGLKSARERGEILATLSGFEQIRTIEEDK